MPFGMLRRHHHLIALMMEAVSISETSSLNDWFLTHCNIDADDRPREFYSKLTKISSSRIIQIVPKVAKSF
jgi:hypothetical protein